MSRLSVFWPEECGSAATVVADEPQILPFPKRSVTRSSFRLDVISRARLLFENRKCRHCNYPVVESIELDDAEVNRQGLEIPGTATIVGFRCQSCDAEWSS